MLEVWNFFHVALDADISKNGLVTLNHLTVKRATVNHQLLITWTVNHETHNLVTVKHSDISSHDSYGNQAVSGCILCLDCLLRISHCRE